MSTSYLLTSKSNQGGEGSIECDFVIIFDAKADKTNAQSVSEQYSQLKQRLEGASLQVTSREGAAGNDELLIFVRAKDARLQADFRTEKLNDWVHNVHGKDNFDPASQSDNATLTPADRLRLAYNLITGLPQGDNHSAGPCAGIIIGKEPFERVKSIFPLHDLEFNKKWLSRWASPKHFLFIPDQDLTRLKDQFGSNIALYFDFLRFYFLSLSLPAVVGVLFWLLGAAYNPLYSVLLVAWSVVFVEFWRIRERILAVRWGTYRCATVARRRNEFTGSVQGVDAVTGERKMTIPWYVREGKALASVPVIVAFGALLFATISAIFATEVLINEVYDGPFKTYLSLLPTILFAVLVPKVIAFWQTIATRLTHFEDHEHEDSFDRSLTLKMFALNAVSAFGSLSLTAYVYIPFGALIVPNVLSFISPKQAMMAAKSSSKHMSREFSINSRKLLNTLSALSTTTQVIGFVTETIVPFATQRISDKVEETRGMPSAASHVGSDSSNERGFLKRVREEAGRPEYTLFGDYAEMVQQFGYVTLWSCIWPLVPLAALINNFFELRADAFKIAVNQRRPIPMRRETIGPWLDTLSFITWLAAFTNASLIYMYRPSRIANAQLGTFAAKAINATASALHTDSPIRNSTEPFFTTRIYAASLDHSDRWESAKTALFTGLLIGLASEHVYLLGRAAVRRVLTEIYWTPSAERLEILRAEGKSKQQYISAAQIDRPAFNTRSSQGNVKDSLTASDEFFDRPDPALDDLRNLVKTE